LVSLLFYFIFFIYKIYFLNSFREEEGKIIPTLTINLDNIKERKDEKKINNLKEEVHLLKNKINELQTIIKKLDTEVNNIYN
jgi:predicted RNase H-like nuclease (RuvC/YqgF family)